MGKIQSESGFTLTELLISVVIIAIGVVGFASAVGLSSTELWMGRRDTELSMAMTQQAESIKAMPYASVQTDSLQVGNYMVNWYVEGWNPKKVTLWATFPRKRGDTDADTIVFYVPR
jgi:prepilin-type N-terminal cleavage/methylation domain-containing protein